ncbi:hypothetical protein [Achromobacter insuavis]|uniref:hypothetical protein n=1 Tax=Achromobacter insuavis TaxID=1287735 RepID=UPI001F13F62E|nr:hypothetical protein [Achromobacter insuavis]
MTATPTTHRLQKVHTKIAATWDELTTLSHKWQPWPTLALGSFFLGNVAARFWDSAGGFLTDTATVGWVTAIATFAAAVVALHVATDNRKQQEKRDRSAGALYSATLVGLTSHTSLAVTDLKILLARREFDHAEALAGARTVREALLTIDIAKIFESDRSFAATVVDAIHDASMICQAHANGELMQEQFELALNELEGNLQKLSDHAMSAYGEYVAPWAN